MNRLPCPPPGPWPGPCPHSWLPKPGRSYLIWKRNQRWNWNISFSATLCNCIVRPNPQYICVFVLPTNLRIWTITYKSMSHLELNDIKRTTGMIMTLKDGYLVKASIDVQCTLWYITMPLMICKNYGQLKWEIQMIQWDPLHHQGIRSKCPNSWRCLFNIASKRTLTAWLSSRLISVTCCLLFQLIFLSSTLGTGAVEPQAAAAAVGSFLGGCTHRVSQTPSGGISSWQDKQSMEWIPPLIPPCLSADLILNILLELMKLDNNCTPHYHTLMYAHQDKSPEACSILKGL